MHLYEYMYEEHKGDEGGGTIKCEDWTNLIREERNLSPTLFNELGSVYIGKPTKNYVPVAISDILP
jgi:hypothetical protein